MISLWLDDLRDPKDPLIQSDYGSTGIETWVKTVEEAKLMLRTGQVTQMSLDHDLGDGVPSGTDLANWLEEESYYGRIEVPAWKIHSANTEGRRFMIMALRSAQKKYNQGVENSV